MKIILSIFILSIPLQIYSQEENYILHKFGLHKEKVNAVDISEDGRYLISGSDDKTIKLVDLADYSEIYSIDAHYGPVKDLHFSGNKNCYYSAGDRVIKRWNLMGEQIRIHTGNVTYIWSFDVSPDEQMITSGSYENYIRIWEGTGEKSVKTIKGHDKSVLSVKFSGDGKYIASGSLDKTVKLWETDSFHLVHTFIGHNDNIYMLDFSTDNKFLLSASNDNTIKIWNLEKMSFEITLTGHEKGVLCAEFSPDGKYIASGSLDNTIKLWDWKRGECIYTYEYHKAEVNDIAFHPEGKKFASASGDKDVILWEIKPELFVYFYYQDEYYKELEKSGLWGPKQKGESLSDFKIRQTKAEQLQKGLIEKYYKKYVLEKFN